MRCLGELVKFTAWRSSRWSHSTRVFAMPSSPSRSMLCWCLMSVSVFWKSRAGCWVDSPSPCAKQSASSIAPSSYSVTAGRRHNRCLSFTQHYMYQHASCRRYILDPVRANQILHSRTGYGTPDHSGPHAQGLGLPAYHQRCSLDVTPSVFRPSR